MGILAGKVDRDRALFSDVVFVEAPELPKLCHPIKKLIGPREYFDSIIVGPIINSDPPSGI